MSLFLIGAFVRNAMYVHDQFIVYFSLLHDNVPL